MECCAYPIPVRHFEICNCQLKTRSEFDKILLDHAEITGAQVFQSTKVMSLDFSGERPVSAQWAHGPSSQSGVITFDYLVDASGRTGLMSTRYLKNRRFNASLKNVAMWAYWRNTDVYARGAAAEGAPYFEALSGMVVLNMIMNVR
jgi:flavin-dependent dehydrogenase